ncbi:Uncharacterised protein [uncultured Collinsella sp.]|nr:Uncharacterised protein [uncultured Collinsella sp.]
MMQRFCYHARGIDHIETGDPCQDAFLFARCGRYIVFGGSDGVGSRRHSERGSRLAVASSVLYVASHLTADMTASEVEDVIRSSFPWRTTRWRSLLGEMASTRASSMRRYA